MANYSQAVFEFRAKNLFVLAQMVGKVKEEAHSILEETVDKEELTADFVLIGRWSLNIEKFETIAEMAEYAEFSESEQGSDWFRAFKYRDGEPEATIEADYFSAEHMEWENDADFWMEEIRSLSEYGDKDEFLKENSDRFHLFCQIFKRDEGEILDELYPEEG